MLEQIVKKSIIGILLTLTALAFILTDSAVGKEQSSALKFIDTISATVNVQAATTIPGKWIQASDGRWWYRHDDGTYTKNNWEYIGGKWYYFDADGWMKTGWILVGGKWYWLSPSGDMVTGWKSIDGTWYYFNSSGAMQTGWQKVDGIWYYFNASGAMQTGWLTLGNNKYYLESSGAMVTGTRIINGTRYTFAESGELISSEPVSTSKGEQIVEHALQYAGNPFKWGGDKFNGRLRQRWIHERSI